MYTRPKMGGTPRPPLANPYCTSSPTPPQDGLVACIPLSRTKPAHLRRLAASSLRPANLAPPGGQPRGLLLAASWSSIAINFPRRWRRRAPCQPTCVRRCSRTHACIPGGWPCILVDIHYPPPTTRNHLNSPTPPASSIPFHPSSLSALSPIVLYHRSPHTAYGPVTDLPIPPVTTCRTYSSPYTTGHHMPYVRGRGFHRRARS